MKNLRLFTVFLVVLIALIGFGIVLPLMPFYASEFGASPIMIGLLYSIYSVAQLIFSPIWGGWSDKIGRRPIMLLSTFGASVAYILFGLADTFTLLMLSRLLAGVMGGNISTAQAYIADVTDVKDRAQGMGLIGAAFGLGFVMGPALATGLIHPLFRLLPLISECRIYRLGFQNTHLDYLPFLPLSCRLPAFCSYTSSSKKPS